MSGLGALARLISRLEVLERTLERQLIRTNNLLREGKVVEVDYANGTAIVDAHGILSKPIPWLQQAGDIVEWTPPAIGQRVVMISPSGDLSRSFIMPGGFTDDVPAPMDQGGNKRVKIGDCVITQSAGGLIIEVGGTTFEFTARGFKQTGGKQEHDGKDVGGTHVHGGVVPGGANTDVPAN